MQREGRNCNWCGVINPRTAHWRVAERRFCCKGHRQNYLDWLKDNPVFEGERKVAEDAELNGYRFPSDTFAHGKSPRKS